MSVLTGLHTYLNFDNDFYDPIQGITWESKDTTLYSGKIGKCGRTSNSYTGDIYMPNDLDCSAITNSCSFSFWYKGDNGLSLKYYDSSTSRYYMYIGNSGASVRYVKSGYEDLVYNFLNGDWSDNVWRHFVFSTDYKVYVNGDSQTRTSVSGVMPTGWSLGNLGTAFIFDGSANDYVDEFSAWTVYATQESVDMLYNNGNGLAYPFEDAWGGAQPFFL